MHKAVFINDALSVHHVDYEREARKFGLRCGSVRISEKGKIPQFLPAFKDVREDLNWVMQESGAEFLSDLDLWFFRDKKLVRHAINKVRVLQSRMQNEPN